MKIKLSHLKNLLEGNAQNLPAKNVLVTPVLKDEDLVWCVTYDGSYGEINASTGRVRIFLDNNSSVFNAVVGAISEWCVVDADQYALENRDKVWGEIDLDPST